jgi:thiamine biosynthesis protein ThiS
MNIIVNGENITHEGDATLSALLESLSININQVAIMIDGEVIKKQNMTSKPIAENNNIDILTMAAGG